MKSISTLYKRFVFHYQVEGFKQPSKKTVLFCKAVWPTWIEGKSLCLILWHSVPKGLFKKKNREREQKRSIDQFCAHFKFPHKSLFSHFSDIIINSITSKFTFFQFISIFSLKKYSYARNFLRGILLILSIIPPPCVLPLLLPISIWQLLCLAIIAAIRWTQKRTEGERRSMLCNHR